MIEDEPGIAGLLSRGLREEGHAVQIARISRRLDMPYPFKQTVGGCAA